MHGKVIYEFGRFRLDPHEHSLLKNGKPVNLSPQLFGLLVVFVENGGHLLTKEELRKRLWGDHHYIAEDALKVIIGNLRKALGESRHGERYIENVFGKGYRFIRTVIPSEQETLDHGPAGPEILPAVQLPAGLPAQSNPESAIRSYTDAANSAQANSADQRSLQAFRSRPRVYRLGLLTCGLVFACFLALAWLFVFPPAHPIVTGYTQLTYEGHQIGEFLYSDGFRVYFNETIGSKTLVAAVPVNGMSEPTFLDTPFKNAWLAGMFPGGESLLIGDAWPAGTFWKVPLPGGPPQPMEKIHGIGIVLAPDGRHYLHLDSRSLFVADMESGESRRIYSSNQSLILSPNWSPDSSMLCFTRLDPEADKGADVFSIWAINADGSNLRNLVSPRLGGAGFCAWTPGEKYVLFSAAVNGRQNLWAVADRARLPFSNPELIHLTNTPADFIAPVASADGKKIFALSTWQRGELVRYDLKAGAWLPFLNGISAGAVDTSRDGKWITYIRHPEGTLWRSRVDGSEARQLTFPPYAADGPHWSPDGKQIAYRSGLQQKAKHIFLISADGGAPRELLPGDANRPEEGIPTWSYDGKSIVFGGLHYSPDRIAIHIVDLATRKVTRVPGSEGLWTPRWSPDGRSLLALTAASDSSVSTSLMLFKFSTRKWKMLLRDAINDPAWSRDGNFIYFNTNDPEPAVKRVRMSDRRIEKIVDLKSFSTEWGPFGVYFGLAPDDSPMMLRRVHETEIYSLEVKW